MTNIWRLVAIVYLTSWVTVEVSADVQEIQSNTESITEPNTASTTEFTTSSNIESNTATPTEFTTNPTTENIAYTKDSARLWDDPIDRIIESSKMLHQLDILLSRLPFSSRLNSFIDIFVSVKENQLWMYLEFNSRYFSFRVLRIPQRPPLMVPLDWLKQARCFEAARSGLQ
ncbi:unnamed protein product [Fasciola hepatica]|uniref:Uncharacterized protein n=1 Tax=Fasciola hepatica TaxID=6192 RepID=A0ABC9HFV1_FASHE